MQRRRQQEGYIFKARGIWYLRYTDTRVIDGEVKRVRIAKQLAPAKGVTKEKARELGKPTLTKVNQPRHAPETAVSLEDFVERVYLPNRYPSLRNPSRHAGRRRNVSVDARMYGERDRPRRADAMVYGWHAWQCHNCSHCVEMMSGVDDVGPKGQLVKICCHRDGITLEQARLFPCIAAVGNHKMTEFL